MILAIFGTVLLMPMLAWITTTLSLLAYGSRGPPNGRWDAIVVPGCRVDADGRPSPALVRRTETGVALWEEGRARLLLFSGGSIDGRPPEAAAAATVARRLGVPDTAIRVELLSTTTAENARFSRRLLGDRRVLVVSDETHLLRCKLIFSRHFRSVAVAPAPRVGRPSLRSVFRETGAVWLSVHRSR